MSRLFIRIFVGFWLVIALVVTGVWVANARLATLEADERTDRERLIAQRREILGGATAALERGGEPALLEWIDEMDRRTRNRLYVIDREGRDVRGRPLPPMVERAAARWRMRPPPARDADPWLGRGMVVGATGPYLIALQRAPQPVLLRVFGPLGPGGVLAFALIVSAAICWWLARTITRPILDLQAAGRALGTGELGARAGPLARARRDEIGMLARDFDRMAERLESLIGSQQRLLRDVSHELRSPLARLQVSLALAQDAADGTTRAKNLARIAKEAERLDALVSEILDYARLASGVQVRADPVDLVEVLDHVAEAARVEGEPRGLRVVRKSPARALVAGDVELLLRAVDNVVRNAVRHSPDGGVIELRIDRTDGAMRWRIEVEDQGPGVPDALLEQIFEPFVRVSEARTETGAGGGVGLAIAREAVTRHGGRISARNRGDGTGLVVSIELPRHDS